jgi:hypothetical protein
MTKATPITTLSLEEIRSVMSEQIRRLQDGETSAATANAISNSVGKILSTVKIELEWAKLTGRKARIPMLDGGDE